MLLPLCGKTRDIAWLLAKGYRVVGVELVETAIEQLFVDLAVESTISQQGSLRHYSADNIDIFVGDFFKVTGDILGAVDAIYDRAALVALPDDMRQRYSKLLRAISGTAPQLLVAYVYDQNKIAGPPFAISDEEVHQHYHQHYTVNCVGRYEEERVWLLLR